MAVRKVNLRAYPKFWADFIGRCDKETDPNWSIPSMLVKVYMEVWYGITVHVTSSAEFGQVYMLNKDYTAFLLRWS